MMIKVQHGRDRERYKPVQEHLQLLWLPPHHALACTGVTIFFISCTDHHIFISCTGINPIPIPDACL